MGFVVKSFKLITEPEDGRMLLNHPNSELLRSDYRADIQISPIDIQRDDVHSSDLGFALGELKELVVACGSAGSLAFIASIIKAFLSSRRISIEVEHPDGRRIKVDSARSDLPAILEQIGKEG